MVDKAVVMCRLFNQCLFLVFSRRQWRRRPRWRNPRWRCAPPAPSCPTPNTWERSVMVSSTDYIHAPRVVCSLLPPPSDTGQLSGSAPPAHWQTQPLFTHSQRHTSPLWPVRKLPRRSAPRLPSISVPHAAKELFIMIISLPNLLIFSVCLGWCLMDDPSSSCMHAYINFY